MGKYLVGINTATAGTTVSIFDIEGKRVGTSFVEAKYHYPLPGEIESKEADVLGCVYKACKEAINLSHIDSSEIIAASFATQAGVLCLLDDNEKVIRDMIGWQDVRATKSIDLNTYISAEELYDITMLSVSLSPNNYLLKLLWMRQNEPENFEKAKVFASEQDFMLQRFGATGHVSDIASITRHSMVDVANRKYCDLIFDRLHLDRTKHPAIAETTTPVGKVSKYAAEQSGLPEGTLLCLGAHDQSAYQIGVGAIHPGDNYMSISTMGACTIVCNRPLRDPQRLLTVKPNPGFSHWSMEGMTLCSSGGITWFRDTFGYRNQEPASNTATAIIHDVKSSEPGARGVTFIPYLQGALGVKQNPNARAVFVGMSAGTTRGDMARAVVEGITYELYEIIESERAAGVALNKIRLSGIAEKFPVWCQIFADVLQTPVEITNIPDAGALGAAMMAGVGAGEFNDLYEAVNQYVHVTKVYEPNPSMASVYEEGFERYLSVVEGLEMARVF